MKQLVLLTVLAAIIAGCGAAGKKEAGGKTYPARTDTLILDQQVRILERNAKKENGLLETSIVAENAGKKAVTFKYRFVWLNKNRAVADVPTTSWCTLTLAPGARSSMKGKAASPDAADFLISVRNN